MPNCSTQKHPPNLPYSPSLVNHFNRLIRAWLENWKAFDPWSSLLPGSVVFAKVVHRTLVGFNGTYDNDFYMGALHESSQWLKLGRGLQGLCRFSRDSSWDVIRSYVWTSFGFYKGCDAQWSPRPY